ncbi:MAG: hypothetical protein LBH76_07715 [Propionibacteriaceae bacterium]|jgi:hypothetical protein|nr:hypothetical protein [Propionibacteriaceae bacterium]
MAHGNLNRQLLVAAALAAALVSSTVGGVGAAAQPLSGDQQKLAQAPEPGPPFSADYASSPDEEERRRAQAWPDGLSPGAFADAERWVSRVFADVVAPPAAETLPSRFTETSLEALQGRLADLAGPDGVFFGYSYDAETDSVFVTGHLPEAALPSAALQSGALVYEYAADGGRDIGTDDSAPR